MNEETVPSPWGPVAERPDGRRSHRRWRFYFLAGVATGTTFGLAIG